MKLKNALRGISNNLMLLAVLMLLAGSSVGCKAKREAQEQERQRQELVQSTASALRGLLADPNVSIEELESEIRRIEALNLTDPEVLALLEQARQLLERKRAEAAANADRPNDNPPNPAVLSREQSLRLSLNQIQDAALANDIDAANQRIAQTLQQFASPDAPVLIVVAREGAIVDYDEPTTIRKYLEYIKDTKNFNKKIDLLELDAQGKITLLELSNP